MSTVYALPAATLIARSREALDGVRLEGVQRVEGIECRERPVIERPERPERGGGQRG